MDAVGGRLRGDLRFSNTLVWNTFPFPKIDAQERSKLVQATKDVLSARTVFDSASLADLYEPNSMPPTLFKAHADLDLVVDSLFESKRKPASTAEPLSMLFSSYESLQPPSP